MAAGDRPGICKLSTARGPIRLLRHFNNQYDRDHKRSFSLSAKSQRGRVFVAEEKKSEMRQSFGSLPLSPLACLVGETSFPAISPT